MNVIVITKRNSASYAIYNESGNCIVRCNDPETTFNDLLKNIGITYTNVFVYEQDSLPLRYSNVSDIHDSNEDNNDVNFDDINDTISFDAPGIDKYRNLVSANIIATPETPEKETVDVVTESKINSKKYPVGNVEKPQTGDLIYVDGIKGILKTIFGGVGTVATVYMNDKLDMKTGTEFIEDSYLDEDEDGEEYEEDSSYEEDIIEKNILVELEEVPGHFFSWSLLKEQQEELANTYGYKPVSSL
jgi:hypothetical protein